MSFFTPAAHPSTVRVVGISKAALRCHTILLLLSLAPNAFGQDTKPASIQVPAGFEVVRVAAPPLVSFPVMGGFDDRGRLFIAENAGVNLDENALAKQLPSRVSVLEDTDGDGVFDRSTVFADRMTFPQGAQWHDGALYVASPPSIWRLEDTDGDGRADSRKEIATGFKFNGNAADVHGPFLHPNGRLYWCHGRKGHEVYQKDGALVSKNLGARIWSCRPDGTDIQIHAGGGMDNPSEVTFNQEGDIFGTVNLFNVNPRSDAVVHWVHGGVYSRPDQEKVIAEFKRTGDLLPAIAFLGHVAPAGAFLMRGDHWGPEYRDNVFLAEFNTRRIMRVTLQRESATFRGRPEIFASTTDAGVHFTDVLEDADGSILVVDTGAWFRIGCPTSGVARPEILGGIYRIRRKDAVPPVDPRGRFIQWAQLPVAQSIEYLADPRASVRERAITEVARKTDAAIAGLGAALRDSRYIMRSNAVWALTRVGSPDSQLAARGALADADPRVRQAACQSAFVTSDHGAFSQLVSLLADEASAVRREAAGALGRLQNPAAIPALMAAAGSAGNDAILNHALIYSLIEIGRPEEVGKFLTHDQPGARRASLIAVDQLSPGKLSPTPVFEGLRSSDAALRSAALQIAIKRPAWASEAADYLEFAFAGTNDARFSDTGAQILNSFLAAEEVREWLRTQIARTEGKATLPPRIAVDAIAKASGTWDESWREFLITALRSPDLSLARATLQAIATHRNRGFGPALAEVAHDSARPAAFRVAALQTAAGGDILDEDSFRMLIEPFVTGGTAEARLQAASVLAQSKLNREQMFTLATRLPGAGPVELPQLLAAFRRGPADAKVAATLLEKIKASPARWSLKGRDLQALFRRFPAPAADNAAPLVTEIFNQTAATDSRVMELEKIAEAGDHARGRQAFLSGAGACVSCHRVGDAGGQIGPDLTRIGRIRNTRDLVEALAFPNATIARGYETFQVETKQGETLLGTIPRETADTVIVVTSDGREVAVSRASISKLAPISASLMPSGLDRALEPGIFADLVAFLKSLQ